MVGIYESFITDQMVIRGAQELHPHLHLAHLQTTPMEITNPEGTAAIRAVMAVGNQV